MILKQEGTLNYNLYRGLCWDNNTICVMKQEGTLNYNLYRGLCWDNNTICVLKQEGTLNYNLYRGRCWDNNRLCYCPNTVPDTNYDFNVPSCFNTQIVLLSQHSPRY